MPSAEPAAAVEERAPAKINLRLDVGPVRDDGYHPLCTLMVALSGLHDDVRVAPAAARAVHCPGVPERDNLAWRALDALEEHCGPLPPVEVTVTKRIPSRAGLGGGSSDAAAALRGADRVLRLGLAPEVLEGIAARVGSDVAFFVRGGAQWATGRGERLRPVEPPRFAAVLWMPPTAGLPTDAVYDRFDRMAPARPADERRPVPVASMPALAAWARNDLWAPALALRPRLGAAARALRAAGARRVLLCGSGSCLAGLADDPGHAAAIAERLAAPGARVVGPEPAPPSG